MTEVLGEAVLSLTGRACTAASPIEDRAARRVWPTSRCPQLGRDRHRGHDHEVVQAVGDEVAEDEPLFEVSTDKVDSEVPSPVAARSPRSTWRRARPSTSAPSWR